MRPSAPDLLRAFAAVCLVGAAWGARGSFVDGPSASPVRSAANDGAGGWSRALAALGTAPTEAALPAVRRDPDAPDAVELGALSALATTRPIAAVLPAPGPELFVAPAGPLAAGRRGALAISLEGPADTTISVFVETAAGSVDTLSARLGDDGTARITAGVEPATPGWKGWRVRALGREARTGAWAEDARPARVALWAAADGWEARYAARALEEAGRELQVRVGLGRGTVVATAAPTPLDSIDAFLLLPGARPTAEERSTIVRRVREGGAGVLIVGAAETQTAGALGLPLSNRRAAAGAPAWSLPADLVPLPATTAATRGSIQVADGPPGSVPGVRDAGGAPAMLLRPAGRGRIAWSGLLETWRWRQVDGAADAHTAYWAALADWLAAGTLAGARLAIPGPARVGAPVRLVRSGPPLVCPPEGGACAASDAPGPEAPYVVRGPAGEASATLAHDTAAFVPDRPGEYALVGPDGRSPIGVRADSTATADHAFGRLALLAWGSGGAALAGAELDAWLAAREERRAPGQAMTWALLAAAIAALLAAWTMRRLRGLP